MFEHCSPVLKAGSLEAFSALLCAFLHVYFVFGFLPLGCFLCAANFRLILVMAVESICIEVTACIFLSGFQHLKSNSTMTGCRQFPSDFHLFMVSW